MANEPEKPEGEFPELHPPGPWMAMLVFVAYFGICYLVVNYSGWADKWVALSIVGGFWITAWTASAVHWNQKHAFAAKHGWRAVYGSGPHGHGSHFKYYADADGNYMDPHTGEKVDDEWKRRRGMDPHGHPLPNAEVKE